MKKSLFFTLAALILPLILISQVQNPASESMGDVNGTTTIAAHEAANGFDIDEFTYSGTGDVDDLITSPASAGANIRLLGSNSNLNFVIDGFATSPGCTSMGIGFYVYKSSNGENGDDFIIEYSTNGINGPWVNAGSISLPTGENGWYQRSISGIPLTPNPLTSIRFTNTSNNNDYRLDDITFTATGTNCIALLPVELSVFTASPSTDNTNVLLKWTTVSELNNSGFEPQRSSDGEVWEPLGWVGGHGTTNEKHEYRFLDEAPSTGINYYRLKQMDLNGFFEYSPTKAVTIRGENILVYPTITQGNITVILPEDSSEETTIYLYNTQGAIICKLLQEGNNTLTITLPQLIPGLYFVEVINGKNSQRTQIFKK